MIRTFELRLAPSRQQVRRLISTLSTACDLYNAALQERRDAWKICRKRITLYDQQHQITELRKCDPETADLSVDIARDPLRRVDLAFAAFFRRCGRGEKPGYPRFKSKARYNSFTSLEFSLKGDRIRLPRLGLFRFRAHRKPTGLPRQVTVKRRGNRWIAKLVCDIGEAPPKVAVSSPVGIDLGLKDFVTLSDGSAIPAPRFIRKRAAAIAAAQRRLARKKRGSKNRLRAKEQVRRAYQRLANARMNFCHHVSRHLVANYDLIAHEDLKIARMARGNLSKSILDAAWGMLLFQLAYKAEEAGRYVVAVNPKGTTQKCSRCGMAVKKRLSDRSHDCPQCGLSLGRDHNAALNILALGRSAVEVKAEGIV